jgi:Uma2 family endonuclease
MTSVSTRLTIADLGRRMSLSAFEHAESRDGQLFELSRGIVTMVEVPDVRHFLQVDAIRRQLYAYQAAFPARLGYIGSGAECKILIEELDSERHPDLLVYSSLPPAQETWSIWIPELVIEVVSVSSQDRDYREKPEEYLRFGVKEYWIVDWFTRKLTVHHRVRGRWKTSVLTPPEIHESRILSGLKLDVSPVFAAADSVEDE